MNAPEMRIPGGEAVDDERPDGRHKRPHRRHWARAALARLGLAVTTAVLCTLLVFGVGWVAAALW